MATGVIATSAGEASSVVATASRPIHAHAASRCATSAITPEIANTPSAACPARLNDNATATPAGVGCGPAIDIGRPAIPIEPHDWS